MYDGSAPDHSLPLFLADRNVEAELRDSSRMLKLGILVATVAAIGGAVLAFGSPMMRLGALTASSVDASASQPADRQPLPAPQTTADVQAAQPAASDAPIRQQPI